jgi:hypothetical protein
MAKHKPAWQYGDTPPANYKELASVIRDGQPKKKAPRKSSGLMDRLDRLEENLKERK